MVVAALLRSSRLGFHAQPSSRRLLPGDTWSSRRPSSVKASERDMPDRPQTPALRINTRKGPPASNFRVLP